MRKNRSAPVLLALMLLLAGCGAVGELAEPAVTPSATCAPTAIPSEKPAATPPALSAEPAVATAAALPKKTTVSVTSAPEPTEETALTCTLWIRCDTILDNKDKLSEEKAELVPEDGILLCAEEISFDAGESVFDLLLRVTRTHNLHLEFVDTPFYNSAYIEGIGNLYEFDCGELSGWSYQVNGVFPGYGSSLYELSDGDVVEWVYTCDLGKDVGGSNGWEGGA